MILNEFPGDSQPSWPEVLATMEACQACEVENMLKRLDFGVVFEATPNGFRVFSDRAASDLAAYEQVTPG